MSEPQELIILRDVYFAYNQRPVLFDINLTVWEGDFLALLGPNGAGKTTMLKIMLGLLRPDRGQVVVFGSPIEFFQNWHLLGYVPQTATHFDPLFPATVYEVVAMALLSRQNPWKRQPKAERETVLAALQLVGLEGKAKVPIGELSSGEQQRAFIARALVHDPKILFLDEPTAGIDAETQQQFYDMLHNFNSQKGITIILVTHDIGIVNRHINRVACLEGKLIYHGCHEEFCRSSLFKELVGRGDHVISHEH